MSISVKDIAWIAGILEGEAWFGTSNNGSSPSIYLRMTDADVVERVRDIIDRSHTISITTDKRKEHYKDSYGFSINGKKAVEWMMIIYPLMSTRRKAKIKISLQQWKEHFNDNMVRKHDPMRTELSGFSRRLNKLGLSEELISMALNMKKLGFTEEIIIQKLRIM